MRRTGLLVLWLVGSVSVWLRPDLAVGVESVDPRLLKCDTIFAGRKATDRTIVIAAIACAQDLAQLALPGGEREIRKNSLDRVALFAAHLFVHGTSESQRREAIRMISDTVETLLQEFSSEGSTYYWRASAITFLAQENDRGAALPLNMVKAVRSIEDNLRNAIALDPAFHFGGPHRVLGILHTKLPALVGGRRGLAKVNLTKALVQAPDFPLNGIAWAEYLIEAGDLEQARSVLQKIVLKDLATVSEFLRFEWAESKEKASELLSEI